MSAAAAAAAAAAADLPISDHLKCVLCMSAENAGDMLICDQSMCSGGFHKTCLKEHKKPIGKTTGDNWSCPECKTFMSRAKNDKDKILEKHAAKWPVSDKSIEHISATKTTFRIVNLESTLFSAASVRFTREYTELPDTLTVTQKRAFEAYVISYASTLHNYYSMTYTKNNHYTKWREFEDYCYAMNERSYAIDNETLLVNFMNHMIERYKEEKDDTAVQLPRELKELGIATNHLIKIQDFKVRPCHEIPAIKLLRKSLVEKAKTHQRENNGDVAKRNRAKVKRFEKAEFKALARGILNGNVNSGRRIAEPSLADVVVDRKDEDEDEDREEDEEQRKKAKTKDFATKRKAHTMNMHMFNSIAATTGRRSADYAILTYSTLTLHTLNDIGPVKCDSIIAPIFVMKEAGDSFLFAWLRNKDPLSCPIGSMAMHIAWMNDCNYYHNIIDIISKDLDKLVIHCTNGQEHYSKWWDFHLFSASDPLKAMPTGTLRAQYKKTLIANGISEKGAVAHLARTDAAAKLIEGGFTQEEVDSKLGWSHSASRDRYAQSAVKVLETLHLAGYPKADRKNLDEQYTCWRQFIDVDAAFPEKFNPLLHGIFPGLDALHARAIELQVKYNADKSAVEFLGVLKFFRRVILEDSIYMYDEHPTFPLFQDHRVFQGMKPLFDEFCAYGKKKALEHENRYYARIGAPSVPLTKPTLNEVINGEPKSQCAEAPSAPSAPSASAPSPIASDTLSRIPQEVADVESLYSAWTSDVVHGISIRDFCANRLKTHKTISWKKVYASTTSKDMHNYISNHFNKLKPFLDYMDLVVNSGMSEDVMVSKLQVVCDHFKPEVSNFSSFLKGCFYYVYHDCKTDTRTLPRISKAAILQQLEAEKLPIPV